MSELGEYTPRRSSFQFLNVKLLHNQSPENYIQFFEKLKEEILKGDVHTIEEMKV